MVAVERMGPHVLFAVERTPCHPESPRWPDQPADRCTLTGPSAQAQVECVEGYLRGAELGLGELPNGLRAGGEPAESPHAPGDPAEGGRPADGEPRAIRCVVHRGAGDLAIEPGEEIALSVDERYRESVSHSHSRCHLVSLALNAALADAWRKEPPARDSLGNPDFDKLRDPLQQDRRAGVGGCLPRGQARAQGGVFRRRAERPRGPGWGGRSDRGALAAVNPRDRRDSGVCSLEERRTWSCELPEGTASFPCGGTHVRRMEPEEGLHVAISWDPEERRLEMTARSGVPEGAVCL